MGVPCRVRVTHGAIVIGLVLLLGVGANPAGKDFASARKAADAFAEKSQPGAKLWRVDVTASYAGGAPEVLDYVFHYVYQHRQGLGVMELYPMPSGSEYDRRDQTNISTEPWQTTPVPGNIRAPEDVLRVLRREVSRTPTLPPRPQGRGAPPNPSRRDLFALRLVYAAAELASSARNQFQWNMLGRTMGLHGANPQLFARTAPSGRWIWWTVVGHDRPDPATDPRRAGTPARVFEYVYIDAITGKLASHCFGPVSGPLPCDASPTTAGTATPGAPAAPPATAPSGAERLLMATGMVKSLSAGRLVIVTDRDASASVRSGTEMTFLLNQPHLRLVRFQSGDAVTVHYEQRGAQLIATEVKLRPSERP